jgi:hypothetical protein
LLFFTSGSSGSGKSFTFPKSTLFPLIDFAILRKRK